MDESIEILNKLINEKIVTDNVYYLKGLINIKINNYKNAIESFNECLKINRQHANSYLGIGNCYYNMGNKELAKNFYDKGINLDSKLIKFIPADLK